MAFFLLAPILRRALLSSCKGVIERAPRPTCCVYISVELLDAVSQAAQKYEALYMGTLPVNKAMGED